MIDQLGEQQRVRWREFRRLAEHIVEPHAAAIDARQEIPTSLRLELGGAGMIASMMPAALGGSDLDSSEYGMLSEELGRTCSNARNFVAVQDMVCDALLRWGTVDQHTWIPRIASGETTAAFLLTEPDIGSDAGSVRTVARDDGDGIVIDGVKKWISFGQCADLFLVFTQYRDQHTAVLVEREQPGVQVTPIIDMLGLRGSMLAEISFDGCRVSPDAVVGLPGGGLVFVASGSLDVGRYSTAWGAVGLAQACLDEAVAYTTSREQGGSALIDYQLVQSLLADMLAESRAARLLCWQAGLATRNEQIAAPYETLTAKYFASRVAAQSSRHAVQLLGAAGMSSSSTAGRFYRDAKALEIIEGTTQVIQQLLGRWSPRAGHPSD